jgi:copper resistance protein B
MRRALLLAAASAIGFAAPAFAQHAGHGASPATAQAPAPSAATGDPACPAEHAAMGHCTPKPSAAGAPPPDAVATPAATPAAQTPPAAPDCTPEHAAMGHCTPRTGMAAGAPPVAPPPRAAFSGPENAADTVWDPQLMARKRQEELIAEHGGYTGYMVLFDRLEYRATDGRDGFAWDAEGWYGGDYDRLWIKTEGEGEFGRAVESAEVQALYSRAIGPWFNLQAGVRYDLRPRPDRGHLVVGVQGLAPYWFEIDAAAFLSEKGDLTARFEAEYDQRITNRLILQPRVEFDLAAQDVRELGVGAGLSTIEVGLRLRYEIEREFAPYVGVEYERRLGDTADFATAAGEDIGGWAFLVGLRSWF